MSTLPRSPVPVTPDDDPARRARAATVTRLVDCLLREIGPAPDGPGPSGSPTRPPDAPWS